MLSPFLLMSQTFVRNSDEKKFDSVAVYGKEKFKDIEEVKLEYEDLKNKKNKTFNSKELKNNFCVIFRNQKLATLIKIDAQKKVFIKSVVFFPDTRFLAHDIKGNIDIEVLPNVNGFPDIDNPILSFKRDISETVQKKWEIILPKIIKYPENGFFITFDYQSNDQGKTSQLKMNKNTAMYFYYPQSDQWKKLNINGYLYIVKFLQ